MCVHYAVGIYLALCTSSDLWTSLLVF